MRRDIIWPLSQSCVNYQLGHVRRSVWDLGPTSVPFLKGLTLSFTGSTTVLGSHSQCHSLLGASNVSIWSANLYYGFKGLEPQETGNQRQDATNPRQLESVQDAVSAFSQYPFLTLKYVIVSWCRTNWLMIGTYLPTVRPKSLRYPASRLWRKNSWVPANFGTTISGYEPITRIEMLIP